LLPTTASRALRHQHPDLLRLRGYLHSEPRECCKEWKAVNLTAILQIANCIPGGPLNMGAPAKEALGWLDVMEFVDVADDHRRQEFRDLVPVRGGVD
jgi:hypothetical protein